MGFNKRQHDYWYPKIEKKQRTLPTYNPIFISKNCWMAEPIPEGSGEYCYWCGAIPETLELHGFSSKLLVEHQDNDPYHNTLENLWLICRGCNRRKNPHRPKAVTLQMSQSESTNKRAEKPWVEWIFEMVHEGQTVTWGYAVAEGAYKFDISTDTIEKRYYRKYFEAPSGPFELIRDDDLSKDVIALKQRDGESKKTENVSYPPTISTTEK